jgi:hypothetical protein
MPSRCGVGPMTLGPCGDKRSGDCGIASETTSSSRFLFSGVEASGLGGPCGVRSTWPVLRRLAVRFEGVCGAAGADNLPRSLLYSLYLFAWSYELHIWKMRYVAYIQISSLALMSSRPAFRPPFCAAKFFSQSFRSSRSTLDLSSTSVILMS